MSQNNSNDEKSLNTSAEESINSKSRIPDKLNFNLEANEYKPKEVLEYIESDDDEEIQQEFDMIAGDVDESEVMNELANQEKLDSSSDESEDEDKWMPKYKDCECCSGFVYKCKGEACSSLGECYCKMKDDLEEERANECKENEKKEKIRN